MVRPRTRARRGCGCSGAARCAALALFCAVVAALGAVSVHAASSSADASASRAPSLTALDRDELRTRERELDAIAEGIGSQLLMTDERRQGAARERDAALELLSRYLAIAYRDASSEQLFEQLLGAGSISAASDRLQLAQTLGRYHANLVRSLDAAEAALDIGELERARLIGALVDTQAQLGEIRDELDRRDLVAQERAQHAAAERAEAAAKQAAKAGAPGSLAGFSPSPSSGPATVSAAALDGYLAMQGSPMAGQGAAFVASGTRWRVDPRLVVAIAGAESNFGQITCGPNNAWGWACPNDPEEFATWATGIETITRGLRSYYLDEGRTSVVLIQQKYAPSGAANDPTGLNNHWVANVTKFLVEQGGNPMMVGPGPAGGPPVPDLGGLGLFAVD